jgi:hypothetical protein
MKTLVQIIFICSTILSTITLTSCKKDACEGVTCQNGGTCNNGSCNCPDGYVRWSNKNGHKILLILCYGKEQKKNNQSSSAV